MFSTAKAYAAGIVALVVLATVGYFFYSYSATQKENKALTTQVITEKIENKDLSQTVEVTQKSDEIAEEAVNHAVQEHQSVDRQFEAIERKAAEREAQLRRNAAMPPAPAASGIQLKPTPPPLAAPSALDDQVSEVRLNSMWESYCTAVPKAVECKVEGKP